MRHRQLVRFLAAGVLSYLIDIGALYVLHGRLGVELAVAAAVAFCFSLVVNFLLNRVVTFMSTGRMRHEAARYLSLVVFSLVATVGIVTGLTALGCPYLWSKTISTALLAVVNFFAYRHWVFAQRSAPQRPPLERETESA